LQFYNIFFFQLSFYFKVQSKKYKQRINKKLCRCVVVVAAVFFYKGGCCVSNSIKTADFVLFSKYLFRLKILCQKKKKKYMGIIYEIQFAFGIEIKT